MENEKRKIIYTDGIYDLFHRGHAESFSQIKKMFPNCYLIVGIINDKDATGYKRKPIYNEEDRYYLVENMKSVDEIVKSAPLIITEEYLDKYKIDLVVHGFSNPNDSQKQDDFFKIPIQLGKFSEIPYYSSISTTEILSRIKNHLL
jgi:choline-phosphate cytidylyltransferase